MFLQAALTLAAAGSGTVHVERLVRGLRAYREHSYRRSTPHVPTLWQDGATRLLDHGSEGDPPLLVLPSLVNRAYILDLCPGRSLLRHLARSGFRPLLLDWGEPSGAELGLDLGGYVLGRAGEALRVAHAATGERPVLLGYCMGGLLACALAAARGGEVAGLALLATPWDFHADGRRLGREAILPLAGTVAATGYAPVELLQSFFLALDPLSVICKFERFGELAPDDPRATLFVAVEDWLNDGVPVAGPVAQECLLHWYGANRPGRGRWRVDGVGVRPERLRLPSFLALPTRDRIVPSASAAALAARLPEPTVIRPAAGHIGMVVGDRGPPELWAPLTAWLRRIAPRRAARTVRPACATT
jgi:poly(3-hydroxyalkanoate) synthetase